MRFFQALFVFFSYFILFSFAQNNTTSPTTTTLPLPANTTSPESDGSKDDDGDKLPLHMKVDATFGILGAVLILTGLSTTFLGGRNRWTSYFLTGFYATALLTIVLILRFGIENQINPPSETTRGLFLLASLLAGIVGGTLAIVFYTATKLAIGATGGFAFGLFLMATKSGGLIENIGGRWGVIIGTTLLMFVLGTIDRFNPIVVILSTSFLGASTFTLGLDCVTTFGGIKEFYVCLIGFGSIFPDSVSHHFPLVSGIQIELGILAAVAIAGFAIQVRVLGLLKKKIGEIKKSEKDREEKEKIAESRLKNQLQGDLDDWEEKHGSRKENGRSKAKDKGTVLEEGGGGDSARQSSTFSLLGGKSVQRAETPATPLSGMMLLDEQRQPNQHHGPGHSEDLSLLRDAESGFPFEDQDPGLMAKQQQLDEIIRIRQSIADLRAGLSSSGDNSPTAPSTASPNVSVTHSRATSGATPLLGPRSQFNNTQATTPGSSSFNNDQASGYFPRLSFNSGSPLLTPGRYGETKHSPTRSLTPGLIAPVKWGDDDPEFGQSSDAIAGQSTGRRTQSMIGWEEYVRDRKTYTPPPGAPSPRKASPLTKPTDLEMGADCVPPTRPSSLAFPQKSEGRARSLVRPLERPHSRRVTSEALMSEVALGTVTRDKARNRMSSATLLEVNNPQGFTSRLEANRDSHKRSKSLGNMMERPKVHTKVVVGDVMQTRAEEKERREREEATKPAKVMDIAELERKHREKMKQLQSPINTTIKTEAETRAMREQGEQTKALILARQKAEAAQQAKRQSRGRPVLSDDESLHNPHREAPQRSGSVGAENTLIGLDNRRLSAPLKVNEWQQLAESRAAQAKKKTVTPPIASGSSANKSKQNWLSY